MEPWRPPLVTCDVERLPDEVLLIVWEYLDTRDVLTASLVCRRWERLISRRALLVRRRSDVHRAQPRLRLLFVAARHTNLINMFNVTRCLHTLIAHERVPLDHADLKVLNELPHLKHLDVFTKGPCLNWALYPRLKTLVINETIAPSELMRGLIYSSNLTQLHMYGRAYYYPPRAMVLLLAARQEHFTELTLRCNELPEAGYVEIGRCPNLVVLRLYACWLLRAQGAMCLTRPPKLRVLHLTGARMLRRKQLLELIKTLPIRLEELSLSGTCFNDDHTAALAGRVPHLRVLELWITRDSVEALLRLAMNLKKLREFDIDKYLSLSQLKELATHPTLERLRCSRPSDISESAYNAAAGRLAPVAVPNARYGRGAMRPDGDGWRSGLFYHWLAYHQLRPLPNDTPPPAFDNDFEDDYSLLGPDIGRTGPDSWVPDYCTYSMSEDPLDLQPDRLETCNRSIIPIKLKVPRHNLRQKGQKSIRNICKGKEKYL